MNKQVKSTAPMVPVFCFSTYWDSDTVAIQKERAMTMWQALVDSGMTGQEAKELICKFQRDAYRDGYSEANFDNCGEDA